MADMPKCYHESERTLPGINEKMIISNLNSQFMVGRIPELAGVSIEWYFLQLLFLDTRAEFLSQLFIFRFSIRMVFAHELIPIRAFDFGNLEDLIDEFSHHNKG